jgi:hypothetical protein
MCEDFHIDMSGRIYKKITIGIACVGVSTKEHNGCVLKGNLIKLIEKNLCLGEVKEEHAKLYAVCIYLLIRDKLDRIESLVICNDEDFIYVKEYLLLLIGEVPTFKIISISDLRKITGRKLKSFADNFAKCYRKRALNRNKWDDGKHLTVVDIDYSKINELWEKLNEIK